MLSASDEAKGSHMQAAGWNEDKPQHFEDLTALVKETKTRKVTKPKPGSTSGETIEETETYYQVADPKVPHQKRHMYTWNSQWVSFSLPLRFDFFTTPKVGEK